MTVPTDTAELASHRDAAAHGRGPSVGFWIMMAFAAACLVAALTVTVVYGVFGRRPATPAETPAIARPAPAAVVPASVFTPAPSPPAAPAGPDLTPSVQLAALDGRVRRLESDEARSLDAAASALAAASLSEAASGPHPFIDDLAAVERLMPGSPHVQALAPLAALGAPTRAALAAELVDIAARASVGARLPPKNAGFMAQLGYAISRVVNVRRVDAVGAGPDAVLARAQRRAAEGDLEGALTMLDSLPAPARDELGDWRQRAQRRIDIDSHIAALRALAMANLASIAGGAP